MKLLLAEDEMRMASALTELLKMENYDVDHVSDGSSLLPIGCFSLSLTGHHFPMIRLPANRCSCSLADLSFASDIVFFQYLNDFCHYLATDFAAFLG